MTVILHITSETTDVNEYKKLLGDEDTLITVCEKDVSADAGIVKLHNEAVSGADSSSDILLLSDSVVLHGNVFEELKSCLYAADKHVIVSGQEIENNESLIKTALACLPEYSVIDLAYSRCALIKRSAVNNLGLFDESKDNLQDAIEDYYHRMNIYGFSAVVSHRVLFSYKNAENKVQTNFAEAHPSVGFLKVIDKNYYTKKRILFDCAIMPAMHCGTAEYQKFIFEAFNRLFGEKYDIFLYISIEAAEFHGLTDKYDNIIYPDTMDGHEKFHIGYAPNQLMHFEHQKLMSKCCLKIVQTMHDIMMVRIDEHGVGESADVELGIRLSDGIVCISQYTKDDFLARYYNAAGIDETKITVIYNATGITAPVKSDYDLPFKEYFLIIGNAYKHKAIKEAIDVVRGSKHNYIVIGYSDNELVASNVYSYRSGNLEDDFVNYLYANCKAVVFPSLYEGFGLPLIIGFKFGKRVIVNKNPLTLELREHFKEFRDYMLFFDRFEQINALVDGIDFNEKLADVEYEDSWDRVAIEYEAFISELLFEDVDINKLNERWALYNLIETKLKKPLDQVDSLKEELALMYQQFGNYSIFKLLYFALKEHIKHRHKWLFRVLYRAVGKG